jgi:CheY-like chemotaxis protein
MSHELRTPMNAVIGMTQTVKTTNDPEKRLERLNKIDEASRELLQRIDDVLDVAGIDYGTFKLVHSVFDWDALIRDILQMTDHNANEKKQAFTHDIDPSIPEALTGDEKRLRQVVVSLLGNAVKYAPENGKIHLSIRVLERTGEKITLQFEISDNGIGILKEKQNDIFRLFEQMDGGLTRRHGGIGLGLALSKHIAGMMDGDIVFESEPGTGSKFIFTCKLAIESQDKTAGTDSLVEVTPAPAAANAVVSAASGLAGKHILIVDDVATNRVVVRNLLTPIGIRTIEAKNGKDAIRVFYEASEDIDLILMDIMMPEMNGYEATRKIRASGLPKADNVPIIALTALNTKEDMEEAKNAGISHHIGKPVEPEKLLAAISSCLL